jgi:preprotein translocase subunit SecY
MAYQPARDTLADTNSAVMQRIAFTFGALLVWRLGSFVPLPGIDLGVFGQLFRSFLAAESVGRVSIFGLGVVPYVAAYIVVHVLCGFFARLRDLRNAGEGGRQRFNQLILYMTVGLAIFQAYGIAMALEGVTSLVPQPGLAFRAGVVISLVAGTMFLVWLGEQISARGIGNGIWVLFAAGFVAEIPGVVVGITGLARGGEIPAWTIVAGAALLVGLIALIVTVQGAERRIPVTHPADGAGDFSHDQTPFIRLKIENAGVLVLLLASSLLGLVLGLISYAAPDMAKWTLGLWRIATHVALIVLLSYFFTATFVDGRKLAREVEQSGVALDTGATVDPGEEVERVLSRLTAIGALYLVVLSVVPQVLFTYASFFFYLSGAPLLVTVLVALAALENVRGRPMTVG